MLRRNLLRAEGCGAPPPPADGLSAPPRAPTSTWYDAARAERDQHLASTFGGVRSDIQNARRLIGKGPGWIDRLRQAMKDGTIPLPVGAFALSQSIQPESRDGGL